MPRQQGGGGAALIPEEQLCPLRSCDGLYIDFWPDLQPRHEEIPPSSSLYEQGKSGAI